MSYKNKHGVVIPSVWVITYSERHVSCAELAGSLAYKTEAAALKECNEFNADSPRGIKYSVKRLSI